jgi:hypothetical protein
MPQAAKWQRIGDDFKAAIIFARADFVNAHEQHIQTTKIP